jgi:hypothetical protein
MAALAVSWPRIHRGRKRLHHRRRRRLTGQGHPARVCLADIGDAMTGLGEKQVIVQGNPGRLRLVVLTPAGIDAAAPPDSARGDVLDAAVPGLARVADTDFPKVECWTDPHARSGFGSAVTEAVKFPDDAGGASRWVLLTGDVAMAQGRYHLALAVRTEKPATARVIDVTAGQWSDFLNVRDVPVEDRGM